MAEESSFHELLERLRHGEEDAAAEIFQQYAKRLIGLARVHLDSAVRRKVDPEDVVQSVFKSFFVRMGKGEFVLENRDNLWSLLVVITLRKCGHKVRDLHRQRQDIRREADPRRVADDSASSWQALAPGPTPAEAAILAETVQQVFGELKERERQMVELHLQGCEIAEIQAHVKRSQYTVRDVLTRVRKRLERCCDHASDANFLWERYFRLLVSCTRQRQGAALLRAEDEKVAGIVFHRFCSGVEQGRFSLRDDRNDLRNVLLLVVARKAAHRMRDDQRENLEEDQGGAGSALPDDNADEATLTKMINLEPTSEMAAEVADECRRLFEKLIDDELRTITLWQMEGCTVKEIAEKLGRSPRSVARKLAQIRDLWSAAT